MQNQEFYLTFDGAVNPPGTLKILEVLEKHGVCATFFVEGHRIAGHEATIREMAARGHHIGNHSFTHPDFSAIGPEACMEEVRRTDEALSQGAGVHTKLLRPPCGILPDDRRAILEAAGYRICLWSISVKDWTGPDAGAVARRTLALATDPVVTAVLHDHVPWTAETAELIIPPLRDRGYHFKPIPYL